jgi:RNA polymerase sigma-70 factor (ECF subfamily)
VSTEAGTDAESLARRCVSAGDVTAAAKLLIEAFGPEVLGWLNAMCRSPSDADDAFAATCERLVRALPTLRREGSLRTWMYVVARNIAYDQHRRERGRNAVPLSDAPELAALVHSTTAAYRATGNKDRLRVLRDALEPEDRTLLVLRVDRELPWRDIAEILAGSDDDPEQLTRDAARLRKRFERVKAQLRAHWDATGGG